MRVFVVDTETTGLCGCDRGDRVVDIGIVEVDTERGTVMPVYSEIVGYDVSGWSEDQINAWIFSHSDLTLDMVARAEPLEEIARDVRLILDGNVAASYNEGFDFDKFLFKSPWNVDCALAPDIMLRAHRLIDGDHLFSDGSSWPKLETAYRGLCPDDPAHLDGPQAHRALSDAVVASYVMLALIGRGEYPARPGWEV
jgi:DNA polymerase III epsilon subunit-like protein